MEEYSFFKKYFENSFKNMIYSVIFFRIIKIGSMKQWAYIDKEFETFLKLFGNS